MINRSIVVGKLPRPTGEDGQRLLDMLWSYFEKFRTWPTFEEIDRRLYAATGKEFEEVIQ